MFNQPIQQYAASDDSAGAPPPSNLASFIQFLQQQNPFFVGAADTLLGQSQGINPAFTQYANAQNSLLDSQRAQQTSQLSDQLARAGVGGSAAINELNRLNSGFNQQQNVLSGQLGLQGVDFANQALLNSLGARSAAITQAGFPASLDVAQTAAQNMGRRGGGGGGGGGMFGTVICSACRFHQDVPEDVYQSAQSYARKHYSLTTYIGYVAWGGRLVRWSFRFPWLYRYLVKPIGIHWAQHAAHASGHRHAADWTGYAIDRIATPVSWLLGSLIRAERKWRFNLRTSAQS